MADLLDTIFLVLAATVSFTKWTQMKVTIQVLAVVVTTPRNFGNIYQFQQPRQASVLENEYICFYHWRFRQFAYTYKGYYCKFYEQLKPNLPLNPRPAATISQLDCRHVPFSFDRGCF